MANDKNLLNAICKIPIPENWEHRISNYDLYSPLWEKACSEKCIQLKVGNSIFFTVCPNAVNHYLKICGLDLNRTYSSKVILNRLASVDATGLTISLYNEIPGSYLLYAGFDKGTPPEEGTVAIILIPHHQTMIAEVRLFVIASPQEKQLTAKELIKNEEFQMYLHLLASCLRTQ